MIRATSILAIAGLFALSLAPIQTGFPLLGADTAFAKGGGGGNGGGNDRGNSGGNRDDRSGGGKGGGRDKAGSSGGRSAGPKERKSAKVDAAAIEEPRNAHGLLASELKGLNAVRANPNAFRNASPNSQVGRIALYRDAAIATVAATEAVTTASVALTSAQEALGDALASLDAYDGAYTGRSTAEIDSDLAALDPAAPDYQDRLAALSGERDAALAYEAGRIDLAAAVDAATTEVLDAEVSLADARITAETAQAEESGALLAASNGRELSDEAIAYIRAQLGL